MTEPSGAGTSLVELGALDPVVTLNQGAVATPRPVPGGSHAVRTLLTRLRRHECADGDVLRFEDLVLDTRTRTVRRAGRRIELTPMEFSLLEFFLRNPRRVLTRRAIFVGVWGFDFGARSNSLNVYVGYLRRKTECGGRPRVIQTVRGVGYVLRRS